MKIYESLGYTPESGTNPMVVGYYVEGENGLYAFVADYTVLDGALYKIELDPTWYWIREYGSA